MRRKIKEEENKRRRWEESWVIPQRIYISPRTRHRNHQASSTLSSAYSFQSTYSFPTVSLYQCIYNVHRLCTSPWTPRIRGKQATIQTTCLSLRSWEIGVIHTIRNTVNELRSTSCSLCIIKLQHFPNLNQRRNLKLLTLEKLCPCVSAYPWTSIIAELPLSKLLLTSILHNRLSVSWIYCLRPRRPLSSS